MSDAKLAFRADAFSMMQAPSLTPKEHIRVWAQLAQRQDLIRHTCSTCHASWTGGIGLPRQCPECVEALRQPRKGKA